MAMRRAGSPAPSSGPTRIATIGVPPVASAVDIEVFAAFAALDDVKLRLASARRITGLPGPMTRSCSASTHSEQSDSEGCVYAAPSTFVLAMKILAASYPISPVFGMTCRTNHVYFPVIADRLPTMRLSGVILRLRLYPNPAMSLLYDLLV